MVRNNVMSIVILIVIILDEELGSWLETLGIKCQSDLPNKIITKVAKALNKTEGGSCTSVETIFLLVLTFFLLGKVRIYKLVQLDPQTNPNQLYAMLIRGSNSFAIRLRNKDLIPFQPKLRSLQEENTAQFYRDEILSHHEIFSAGHGSHLEVLQRETSQVEERQGWRGRRSCCGDRQRESR